jgi:hypothetical protein
MRKPEPVELVHAEVPLLVEALVLVPFLTMIAVWAALASGA